MEKITLKIGGVMSDDFNRLVNHKKVGNVHGNVIYFKNIRQFTSSFSVENLSLPQYLSKLMGKPVAKVTIELGPSKEELDRELRQLEKIDIMQMGRSGEMVYPKVSYEAVRIELKR